MSNDVSQAELDLSVVVPLLDEEENLPILIAEIHAALRPTGMTYEIICVDDGSSDGSWDFLKSQASKDDSIRGIRFRKNFGQTAAIQAGLDMARGAIITMLDADLQNDPADLPRLIERLKDEGCDLVTGWRVVRKDAFFSRRLPSIIANALIGRITGVRVRDYGCTLKAMRREVAKEIRLYGEMHRFIPAIASWSGAVISEIEVNHRPRRFGRTKYGIGRVVPVILDLITVRFLQSFLVRPMQAFGLWGLILSAGGSAMVGWLVLQRLFWNQPLTDRPIFLLALLAIAFGVQLLCTGLLADLVTRTYHESQEKRTYSIREQTRTEHQPDVTAI